MYRKRGWKRAAIGACSVALLTAGLMGAPTAAHAETVDPSCTTASGNYAYLPTALTRGLVQTFTATTSTVSGFDVLFRNQTVSTRLLNAQLLADGPDGAVLAQTQGRALKQHTEPLWVRFRLTNPVSVTPGSVYAIKVSTTGYASPNGPVVHQCSDSYAGGSGFRYDNATSSYVDMGTDFGFRALSDPTRSVSIGDASILEGTNGIDPTKLMIPVTLSQPGTAPVTVSYTLADITATGAPGAAIGIDYYDVGGTVTFPMKGAKTATLAYVTVPVFTDTNIEADESLSVTLSSPNGGYGIGRGTGTGTVLDDDGGAALTAGIGDMTIVKGSVGNQALKVPVTLSQKPGLATTIGYSVAPGTATRSSSAAKGGDYGGKAGGALNFGAGATSKSIALPIWPDPNPSSLAKSLTISFGSVTGAAVTVLHPTATITILPVPSSGNLPGRATGGTLTFGGSCTAPGPLAGTEATVTWNAPTLGDAFTGYQVTYRVTLPGEDPAVETEFIAAPQTTTGTRCYPVNAAVSVGVAATNTAGTTLPSAGAGFWAPPSGLTWTSPPSVSDGVDETFSSIDPCPTQRPDGNPVEISVFQIDLTTSAGTLHKGGLGPNWSITGAFDADGLQDPSATIRVYCGDFLWNVGNNVTAVYEIHPIVVNP